MSTFSGNVRPKHIVSVKGADGSVRVEVSLPMGYIEDPKLIIPILSDAIEQIEALHKKNVAPSKDIPRQKGLLNTIVGALKGKSKVRKTQIPTDEIPIMPPPSGTKITELKVNRAGNGTEHIDTPILKKGKSPAINRMKPSDLTNLKNGLRSVSRSEPAASGKPALPPKPSTQMKINGGLRNITPGMLSLQRKTLRKTSSNNTNNSNKSNIGLFGSSNVNSMLARVANN